MNAKMVLSRILGLAAFWVKVGVGRSRVVASPTAWIAPSIRLHLDPGARLYVAKRVVLGYEVDITCIGDAEIDIGEGAYLGPRCMLSAHQSICIGEGALLGPDVKVFDNNHRFEPGRGVIRGLHSKSGVKIGRNVWLGANVVLLKGVTIGDGAVVGAGVIVRADVPPGAVITGGVEGEGITAR